jgi:hypothetical protein
MPKFRPKGVPPPEPVVEVRDPLPVLLERVDELQRDIEEVIANRVTELKVGVSGVPEGCIRTDITRGEHCRCSILRRWVEEAETAMAKVAAAEAEEKAKADAEAPAKV